MAGIALTYGLCQVSLWSMKLSQPPLSFLVSLSLSSTTHHCSLTSYPSLYQHTAMTTGHAWMATTPFWSAQLGQLFNQTYHRYLRVAWP